ncbi:ser thr phosphatase family [Fusarium mexicanum]|uniref:Ser thr phosphatase family n=1 Tax=Fusarium mexicanum TaxID=751941 RepID=A0A8H5IP51_9HYPO|nr:ser thr phosphatase family [Fusarium mexicanum]
MDWSSLKQVGVALGQKTLLTTREHDKTSLSDGYIPLLVNLTVEDKAAKGLRKHKGGNAREEAVYVSATEAVRDNRLLLLTGGSGSGKTTFAEYLIFEYATGIIQKDSDVVLNNEGGERRKETSRGFRPVPLLITITKKQDLADIDGKLPGILESWASREKGCENDGLLLILDGIENSGSEGLRNLASITDAITPKPHVRLLVLGRDSAIQDWDLPAGFSKIQLLPLLASQRRQLAQKLSLNADFGSGNAASIPAIFALCFAGGHVGDTSEAALDAWLGLCYPSPEKRQAILRDAYDAWVHQRHSQSNDLAEVIKKWPFVSCTAVQELLVAAQLQIASFREILQVFDQNAKSAVPIVRSLLYRFTKGEKQERFVRGFLNQYVDDLDGEKAQYAALVACEFIDHRNVPLVTQVVATLLKVIKLGTLPFHYRVLAGRYLSLFGDPRELTDLVEIPGGTSLFGSSNHPNSSPVHELYLGPFKIGAFPVVNRDYGDFVKQTGRTWLSQDGYDAYTQNAPATDLTWHDARAYCRWLTKKWRETGKIERNETVQLPSEPQWERASRGGQCESQAGQNIYPWGTNFLTSLSNCEELGLNNKCAVGLFPQSSSPFGCYDMVGQVWEWCTTLWGEDMATSTFIYPWSSSDGSEDLDANASIRRVLRGGCFSSGQAKATCTYRGSLEPTGFWRGNGFRIVVVSEYIERPTTMPVLKDVQLSGPKDLAPLVGSGEPIYVILTSSNDEETGAPWCSDVRAALPFLEETFDKQDGPTSVYESVGPRPGWKKPDNPHKLTWGISAIPTVIRFELRDGSVEEKGRLVEAEVYEDGKLQSFVSKSG